MIESVITVKPFRFWCQKVLPLVYDDSLSYYELLCKVVDYINGLLTDDTNVITQVNELTTFVNDYFTNLDVQQEINNKLDDMVENGQLDEVISHYVDPYIAAQNTRITNFETTVNTHLSTQDSDIDVLEARMDTFASLPTGSLSTDADAELVDIRIGADGTTYSTAGNAVRGQVSDLKTETQKISSETDNLFWFTDTTNRSRDGVTLTFIDRSTIKVNGTTTANVTLFSRGGTSASDATLPAGTYIYNVKLISGTGTASKLRFGSSLTTKDMNTALTFDSATSACMRLSSGSTYSNAVFRVNLNEGSTIKEYIEGGVTAKDNVARDGLKPLEALTEKTLTGENFQRNH